MSAQEYWPEFLVTRRLMSAFPRKALESRSRSVTSRQLIGRLTQSRVTGFGRDSWPNSALPLALIFVRLFGVLTPVRCAYSNDFWNGFYICSSTIPRSAHHRLAIVKIVDACDRLQWLVFTSRERAFEFHDR